jgi:hypothetical protein
VERTIQAPDTDTLDDEQAARWLGIKVGVWRKMVAAGVAPQPMRFGTRTPRWHWMDVVAVLHLLSRGMPGAADEGAAADEAPAAH